MSSTDNKPLYTLYVNLKAQGWDVPDSYALFEKTLTQPGDAGAQSRRTLHKNLYANDFDVPATYESFYTTLFEPVNRTTSRAKSATSKPTSESNAKPNSAWVQKAVATAGNIVNTAKANVQRTTNRMQNMTTNAGLKTQKTEIGAKGDGMKVGMYNNRTTKTKPKYDEQTGTIRSNYISESGNEYTSREMADLDNIESAQTLGAGWNEKQIIENQKPARSAITAVWEETEKQFAADKEANAKETYGDNPWLHAGREMHTVDAATNNYKNAISKMTRFDLQNMMDKTWTRVGKLMTQSCYDQLRKKYPTVAYAQLQRSAETLARQLSDNAVYQYAVEQNAPQNVLDYFAKTARDMNLVRKLTLGAARSAAGTSGDLSAYEKAMEQYGKNHQVAKIGGTVVGMAADPTTLISGGVSSLATKGAAALAARYAFGGVAAGVGARLMSNSLAGRVATGMVAGGTNFATYNAIDEAANQYMHGGHVNAKTGEVEDYSAAEILKATSRGVLLGSATGAISPILGNVADKAVKATNNTAGKIAIRTGEYATSAVAEGTVFSLPEWISGEGNAMDVWTDNMAMVLGFKASHAIKSAPQRINELRKVSDPKTQAERTQNRKGFLERLANQLDKSPSDMSFTPEEKEELARAGYNTLASLLHKPNKKRAQQQRNNNTVPKSTDLIVRTFDDNVPNANAEDVWLAAHPEFDGYEQIQSLIQDPSVSQAVRAKVYYLLTGRQLPMGTVAGCTRETDEKGNIYVKSTTADGEVVTRKRCKDESSAQMEEDKIMRQAELNSIDVGERFNEEKVNDKLLNAAIQAISPEASPEIVKRNYKAVKAGNKEAIDQFGKIASKIDNFLEQNADMFATERPEAIRADIKSKSGVDVDDALRKTPSKRSKLENDAVQEYLERLFPDESTKGQETVDANRQLGYDGSATAHSSSEFGEGSTTDGNTAPMSSTDDASRKLDEALANCESAFGTEADALMPQLKSNPWGLLDNPQLTEFQKDAVINFLNAKRTMEEASDPNYQAIRRRTHQDDHTVQPVTLKERNADGSNKKAYVVKGKIMTRPDGTIDIQNSDKSIIICDGETGKYKFTSPDQIFNADQPADPNSVYEAERAKSQPQNVDTEDIHPDSNQKVVYDYNEEALQTKAYTKSWLESTLHYLNGEISAKDYLRERGVSENAISELSGDEVQELADAKAKLLTDEGLFTERTVTPAAGIADQDNASKGDNAQPISEQETTLGNIAVGDYLSINGNTYRIESVEDGKCILAKDGRRYTWEIPYIERGIAEGTVKRVEPSTQNSEITKSETSGGDNENFSNSLTAEGKTTLSGQETQTNDTNIPQTGERSVLSHIPKVEGTDEYDFESVDSQTTLDGIEELANGDKDLVSNIVESQVKQAQDELKSLGKKRPKKKTTKLSGTPVQMLQQQKEANDKYAAEVEAHEEKVRQAQDRFNYWSGVYSTMHDRQKSERAQAEQALADENQRLHEKAVAQLEEDKAQRTQREKEQKERGAYAVSPQIKTKWDNAPKVVGNSNAVTLADGTTVRGHYVLTEAGAASASHDINNGFEPTEGFPVDNNGESVNDRDYERDKDAQHMVYEIADNYDSRALQTPVIVSQDGVVLSGNNRTMSGDIAARQGSDNAYIEHLREFGNMYGFTPEQISSQKHPRVLFVLDEDMPYNAQTFAKFNAEDKKTQSKPEAAVKLGKVVPDDTFMRIAANIAQFDRMPDFYADPNASKSALSELFDAGVINEMQLPKMMTGNTLSAEGRELIENTLIGKVFQANPDAVREIISTPALRQSVLMALSEIVHNRTFEKSGFGLGDELANAIDLVYRAKSENPDIYKDGMPVSPFGRQEGLFDEEYGSKAVTDATVLLLADVLNSGKPSDLRKVLAVYNDRANNPANGVQDMFAGGLISKEDILKEVNETFKNATPKEQQALVDAAVAERKQRAETTAQTTDGTQRDRENPSEATAENGRVGLRNDGRGRTEGYTDQRQSNLAETGDVADNGVSEWYQNLRLSGELDQNNSPFILSPNGQIDFGHITEAHHLPAAPIRLSMGDIANGYIHINRRHGKQIQKAGFDSIETFVDYVVNNFTRIKEGTSYNNANGGKNNTYLIQLQDGHNNTLFVQLSRDGKYWNVNSAGVFGKKYGDKKEEIWSASEVQNDNSAVASDGLQSEPIAENGSTSNGTPSKNEEYDRHATAKQPVETIETSQGVEQSDTQEPSRMNVPTSSASKVRNKQSALQENNEKSSVNSEENPLLKKTKEASDNVSTEPTETQGENKRKSLRETDGEPHAYSGQPLTERTRQACESVAKSLGIDVEWVDHLSANGEFDRNGKNGRPVIRIARDAENPLSTVFGHEGTHAVRSISEEAYQSLADKARVVVGEEEWNNRFNEAKKRYRKEHLTDDQITEEVVDDIVGEMFTDQDLAEKIAYRLDHPILAALRDVARKIWEAIKRFVGGNKLTAHEQAVKDFADTIEQAFADSKKKAEKRKQAIDNGVSSVMDAANADAVGGKVFNLRTEDDVADALRNHLKEERQNAKSTIKWTDEQIESIISETRDLIDLIHDALTGNVLYDEWAKKEPTLRIDWRDGEEKPIVTWARNNIEYTYDVSADLLCINNEGIERTLSSPDMVELMIEINKSHKDGYTSADYMRLYETLRDLGLNVPCKGCFDASARFKMLPSVSRKFVDLVNETIDKRNADPEAFDAAVRKMAGKETTVNGLPTTAKNKANAIAIGVAGDKLTEHISWTQLMSAEGQTKALADWGGIFRAWQRTGAGRPKDKLNPEPYAGVLTHEVGTIIGQYGEKTPSFRDLEVNQGTGLRRNSHSEFRPLLAIDEIQFMRDAFFKNLCVFKYMKELDDVRLFGKMGVKFNMSFFPGFEKGAPAAGLDKHGNYLASEESVGSREFVYYDENGKQHFDGMRGLEEAEKYINENVSLSSVVFSIPHLIRALIDVPTPKDPSGRWGSLIPFHATGATAVQLYKQGLGFARALQPGTFTKEAFTDYDKGVTNFEDVQNDRFGPGWTIISGTKAGTDVEEGHKLEFANGTHYYNKNLGVHLFKSFYVLDKDLSTEDREKLMNPKLGNKDKRRIRKEAGHDFAIEYNDKVRELGGDYAYKDAADYYLDSLPEIGIIPRFDFTVPEDKFLEMCAKGDEPVDPRHPKLGWKGEGHGWSPADSDAYYSLFCDYGMTDPATGKWSPHRPVGVIDENGNRVFKLPENTVDIVREGVRRYTEQREKETAMHDEIMSEYLKRTVADGKLTQEQADAFKERMREEKVADSSTDGTRHSLRSKVTPEERAMRDELANTMKNAGIDVSVDEEVGQKVMDMEREMGDVRLEAKRVSERKQWLNNYTNAINTLYGTDKKKVRADMEQKITEARQEAKELYAKVLSGNFDDVTLQQIDNYIDHATNRNRHYRPLSQRLRERTLLSLQKNGRTAEVDALFSRICESAVPKNGRVSAEGRRRIEAKKEELLEKWAKAAGQWHESVADFTENTTPFKSGTDSDVYLSNDGKTVIKASRGKFDNKKYPSDIDQVALFNSIFPHSAYSIIGYGKQNGHFVKFLKQDFVDFSTSVPLSEEEKVAYMHRLGFEPRNKEKTVFSNGEILVSDLQKSNIVRDVDGNIRVIDADVKLHTRDIGGKYDYPPVEEDVVSPYKKAEEQSDSAETNADTIREQRVYHGSGADFDHFDHSFMGTGEGLQIHGYGTYVTVSKETGEGYARKLADEDGSGNLYSVEVPDNTGDNYLEESQEYTPQSPLRKSIDAALQNRGLEPLGSETLGGRLLYRALKKELGGGKAASDFLSELGLKGVHYTGRQDGECYVIFNEADAKITDHIRFFRTPNGEAYGFTKDGKIYIDPSIAKADTPIHEYTHLWSTALRQGNPEEWANVVNLMKGEKELWDEVKKRYPELKTDDEIADEVLAHYSGKRGAERLREEQRKIAEGEGSTFEKARAIRALEKVKQALNKFWKGVADFLHIHYTSAEEVADRVMSDLLNGVNPTKYGTDNKVREQFLGEKGAENLDKYYVTKDRMDNKSVAEEMEKADKDAAAIKMATGWERGADGKWRYEVPDFELKEPDEWIKKRGAKLKDVVSGEYAEKLFAAYPELENVKIKKTVSSNKRGAYIPSDSTIELSLGDYKNALSFLKNVPNPNSERAKAYIAKRIDAIEGTLVHEVQHAIQHIEGFAKGGSPSMRLWPEDKSGRILEELDRLLAQISAIKRQQHEYEKEGKSTDELVEKRKALLQEYAELDEKFHNAAPRLGYDGYRRLAGEVEARNVSNRRSLSDIDRRNTLASATEDVPRDKQITVNGDGNGGGKPYSLRKGETRTDEQEDMTNAEMVGSNNNAVLFREMSEEELSQRVEKYDAENDSELGRFVDYLERGRSLNNGENGRFKIGKTGDLLNKYGINGDISITTRAVNPNWHTQDEDHNLTPSEWVESMESINNPLAITAYQNKPNSFRIYTNAIKNGKSICLGVDVKRNGNGVEIDGVSEITDIKTAFGRNVESAINKETILYPEGSDAAEQIRRNFAQSSEAPNSLLYGQSSVSAAKIENKSENSQETTEKESPEAKTAAADSLVERVNELSEHLNTPVHIIRTEEEVAQLPSERQRRMKGSFNPSTGEVTIVVPNNANLADIENTFVHEVVGHDGLRVLFPEEATFNNAMDELYRVSTDAIKRDIDRNAQKMYDAEVERIRERKQNEHKAKGENPSASYDADTAEAHVEASKKKDKFRRDATEEYGSDLAGRIGEGGFERMSAEEQTFWGKLKAVLQKALQKLLDGLKIPGRIKFGDKEWAFVLHEAYKRKKNGGKPSVFDVADTVAMRQKTGFGEKESNAGGSEQLSANERFNRELSRYLNGEMNTNEMLHLGRPQGVMRAFLPNLPIVMRQRVIKKGSEKKHEVDVSAIMDMPRHLSSPVFVFRRSEDTIGVLTDMRDRNGKNVCVAIELKRQIQQGAEYLEVNDVRSFHGREFKNIVEPIANNKTLKWVDKEKGLAYLSSASQPVQQEINKQVLHTATKVVKDFVNPKVPDENISDDGIMFRDGDAKDYTKTMARDAYERRVSRGMYQTIEAMQDSMLGLKEAMEAVLKAEGTYTGRIEDVAGHENPYLGENRLSSVNQAEASEFNRTLWKPLLSEVSKLAKTADERAELTDYMMAKHGLERNDVMALRAAQKQVRKEFGAELRAAEKALNNDPLDAMLQFALADVKQRMADRESKLYFENRGRDYAGLTALTETDNVADAEFEAQKMVQTYESAHDTTDLWAKIRAVTDATLTKSYASGMIDRDTYNDIKGMYQNYIPLRGFDETTSDDVYAYLNDRKSGFSNPIKTAKGRKSKADDPFANMEAMAESSIMQGNRNVLVKQKMLNFALAHPSDLISVSDLWLRYDDVADEWEPVNTGDVAGTDKLEADDSPADVERKMEAFESAMEQLAANDPAHFVKQGEHPEIPYRVVDTSTEREHQIIVKRNGKDYVLTINGNPRAAQALNGQTNPDNEVNGALGKLLGVGQAINRQLSAFYTTRNPDFVVSNFVRDAIYSNTQTWMKETPGYAWRFNLNFMKVNPAKMKMLFSRLRKGELDMSDATDKMFYQFIINGGETGYSNIRDIEQRKSDIKRELQMNNGKLPLKKAWLLLGERFDEYNRAVENCARFTAFMTSRQMKRPIERAVWDAKEISVNFNKKGSGAKFIDSKDQTKSGKAAAFVSGIGRSFYVFWNAAVQGTWNFGKNAARNPKKALTGAAALFLLGALVAAMGNDDDKDDKDSYYNLPEYVRRSNIVFRLPGMDGQWISLPLPVEYRSIYGMGELMASAFSDKQHMTDEEIASAMAGQISQMMPIDMLEGGGGWSPFVPSAVKPFAEVARNEAWTGMPIYSDSEWNKDMPEWTKAFKSADQNLVSTSAWLNEISGGDRYTKGEIDINPAKIEYLLTGYFGGVANTLDRMVKMGETILGKREYDPKSFLILNRLVKNGDERTESRALTNEYYRLREEYERTKSRLKHYEDDTDDGVFDYADKIKKLNNSPEYQRMEIFEDYGPDIDEINQELKEPMSDTERKELEQEKIGLMRELIKEVNKTRKRE
jgi:hypothetical protein